MSEKTYAVFRKKFAFICGQFYVGAYLCICKNVYEDLSTYTSLNLEGIKVNPTISGKKVNNMFENTTKGMVVHSFEDLSLAEMNALQEDNGVEAEITPSTTSSAFCIGAGLGALATLTIKKC